MVLALHSTVIHSELINAGALRRALALFFLYRGACTLRALRALQVMPMPTH